MVLEYPMETRPRDRSHQDFARQSAWMGWWRAAFSLSVSRLLDGWMLPSWCNDDFTTYEEQDEQMTCTRPYIPYIPIN